MGPETGIPLGGTLPVVRHVRHTILPSLANLDQLQLHTLQVFGCVLLLWTCGDRHHAFQLGPMNTLDSFSSSALNG